MRELERCPDCGTEFIVACGPPGCIAVPACQCAEEKRKAERQAEYERTRCWWRERNGRRCSYAALPDVMFCEAHSEAFRGVLDALSRAALAPMPDAGTRPDTAEAPTTNPVAERDS